MSAGDALDKVRLCGPLPRKSVRGHYEEQYVSQRAEMKAKLPSLTSTLATCCLLLKVHLLANQTTINAMKVWQSVKKSNTLYLIIIYRLEIY